MSSYGLIEVYVYTVSLYYYIIIPIINHTQYTRKIRNNEITARLIADRLHIKRSDHSKIDDTFEQLFIIIS